MLETVAFVGDAWSVEIRWDEWFPEYDIRSFGFVGGTDEVLAQLGLVVDAAPSTVVVQVGASDLGWGRSDEHIVRNIESILFTLRGRLPQCRIVVQSVPPLAPDLAGLIRSINHHIRQFATTVKASYVDVWPDWADPDGSLSLNWSLNRSHLTDEGLGAWVAQLRPVLIDLFARPPQPSQDV
jgi:lysophospholipase L1-like esterase